VKGERSSLQWRFGHDCARRRDDPVSAWTPTAVALLARDDGTLVLRAESPDAVDGFYNVTAMKNAPAGALEVCAARPGTRAAARGPVLLTSPRPSRPSRRQAQNARHRQTRAQARAFVRRPFTDGDPIRNRASASGRAAQAIPQRRANGR